LHHSNNFKRFVLCIARCQYIDYIIFIVVEWFSYNLIFLFADLRFWFCVYSTAKISMSCEIFYKLPVY
jgi:hypothetical protein